MNNIVNLILTCQVKDQGIPQLIPFFWFMADFMLFFILLILINVYFNNFVRFVNKVNISKIILVKFLW